MAVSSDRTLFSKKPVFTPNDLKGVKLRMFQARVPVLTWQTLGTNTVIIPWGEIYTALATGTVEAVTARVEAHYATEADRGREIFDRDPGILSRSICR